VIRRVLAISFGLALILTFSLALAQEAEQGSPAGSAGVYADFDDILLPFELSVDKGNSFVYDTDSFTAGVLHLEGRVEVKSLTRYFAKHMIQDDWILAAKFTSPRILLLFEKPNKRAIMIITESKLKTHVQVWVAPFLAKGQKP